MDDAVQHIKLPAWYKPPKEWTEDGLVELVNARADDAYWTSLLGEDYDTIWTDHQPTQEELKQAGLEYAKTLDENIDTSKIPDEYAINLGVYAINDKLIEKNETKQSKMADTNVDAERLSYSWNPKDGVTSVWGLNLEDLEWSPYGGAGDIQDKANGAISNILLKKFMPNAEVTEDDYAVLNDLGMTDIVDYLKNIETVQYSNLPGSAQEQLKKNAISTVKGIVEFQEKLETAAPKEQEIRQNSDFEDVTATHHQYPRTGIPISHPARMICMGQYKKDINSTNTKQSLWNQKLKIPIGSWLMERLLRNNMMSGLLPFRARWKPLKQMQAIGRDLIL